MNKKVMVAVLPVIFLGLLLIGCQPSAALPESEDILFQYSTLGSLSAGVFDGNITYTELKTRGDFGLGTFNALDGEMIEVDHQVYQIKSDGVVYPVDGNLKSPFAVVTHFEADQTIQVVEPMDCTQLRSYLDTLLPTENIPYAIKVTGIFSAMQARSVPRQEKPYPPLADVVKIQSVFEFKDVEGVMVGFRLPDYMDIVNAPGYHFHFITADRRAGGHVLDCKAQKVTVEIDNTGEWHAVLPEDDAFYKLDLAPD